MRISDWSSDVCSSDLRYANVVYVRNITDIDDKINAVAKKEGVDIRVISDRYAAIYHDDMAALGARATDHTPRVTAHLPPIPTIIDRTSFVSGKSVSDSVELGGRGIHQKKNNNQ